MSEHYLTPYLAETLPALGLDADAYIPYVTGFADEEQDEETALDDLIELLRASSETHGDDDKSWDNFRREVVQRIQEQARGEETKKEEELLKSRQKEQDLLNKEIQLAQRSEEEKIRQKKKKQEEKKEIDVAKRALVAKYAYDDSEVYDDDGNIVAHGASGGGDADAAPVSNRDVAAKMVQEQRDKLKAVSTQSKKAAREETAKAKMDKSRQKEERRKRATKGERKR